MESNREKENKAAENFVLNKIFCEKCISDYQATMLTKFFLNMFRRNFEVEPCSERTFAKNLK